MSETSETSADEEAEDRLVPEDVLVCKDMKKVDGAPVEPSDCTMFPFTLYFA